MKTFRPPALYLVTALVSAPLMAGCAALPAPVMSPAAPAIDATATQTLLAKVADWQLAHLQPIDYVNPVGRTRDPRGWIQGVFWLGLTRAADALGRQDYTGAILQHGQEQQWQLGSRTYVADDQLTGQTWLWAYERTHDAATIAPMRASFDQVLATPSSVSLDYGPLDASGQLACLQRWCWADALFMAPASWAGLSRAVHDPRYAAFAKAEMRATLQLLYDPDEHLMFRDSRFLTQRDPQGGKIFWNRGNAWVLAGLANVLQALPDDDADRQPFVTVFQQMALRLAGLQRADGSWPSSLLARDTDQPGDTSGNALFVYALAWGVRTGVLDRARFAPVVARGWTHVTQAVDDNGRVGWVQPIGDSPHVPRQEDTQLYGSGAVLMAGSEILKLYPPRP